MSRSWKEIEKDWEKIINTEYVSTYTDNKNLSLKERKALKDAERENVSEYRNKKLAEVRKIRHEVLEKIKEEVPEIKNSEEKVLKILETAEDVGLIETWPDMLEINMMKLHSMIDLAKTILRQD